MIDRSKFKKNILQYSRTIDEINRPFLEFCKSNEHSNSCNIRGKSKDTPLIREGDLSCIYRSRTKTLPEILNPDAFTVRESDLAKTTGDDIGFRQEANKVLSSLKDLSRTYIIVDIGHAHLLPVAVTLASYGVDSHFMIPGEIHPRLKESLKYWADEFQDMQRSITAPIAYATLLDCHRDYEVAKNKFPSADRLKELGVTTVLYLNESRPGFVSPGSLSRYLEVCNHFDLYNQNYQDKGLEVKVCGIDPRQKPRPSQPDRCYSCSPESSR